MQESVVDMCDASRWTLASRISNTTWLSLKQLSPRLDGHWEVLDVWRKKRSIFARVEERKSLVLCQLTRSALRPVGLLHSVRWSHVDSKTVTRFSFVGNTKFPISRWSPSSGLLHLQLHRTLRLEQKRVMVFFFKLDYEGQKPNQYLLYMGEDEVENDALIAHGLPTDVWFVFQSCAFNFVFLRFHVDALSSAHVYIRLPKGMTIDDLSKVAPPTLCPDLDWHLFLL